MNISRKIFFSLVTLISFSNITPLLADDYDSSFEDGLLEQLTASVESEEEQIENYKKEVLLLPEDSSFIEEDLPIKVQTNEVVVEIKKAPKSVSKKPIAKSVNKPKERLEVVQDEIKKINKSLDTIRAEQTKLANDAIASINSTIKPQYNDNYFDDDDENIQKDNYFQKVTVVTTPAILRSSPSRESGRIYALNTGEVLPVIIHRGDWYLVQANKVRAWIPADVVTVSNY